MTADGTSSPVRPLDPGFARERTMLAWNRSGLAAVVCIAVVLRHVWPIRGAGQYLALGLVAGAAMLWAVALLILGRSGADRQDNLVARPRVFRLMTAGTLVLALIGLGLSFATPSSG